MGIETEHLVFLERKFPDRDPSPEIIRDIGATGIIAWLDNYDATSLDAFREKGLTVDIAVAGFQKGLCPLTDGARQRLVAIAQNALQFVPRTIIFDHFRFDGVWEQYRDETMPGTHLACANCSNKNRAKGIARLAQEVRESVDPNVQLGYFDVPFYPDEVPELGQDSRLLSNFFAVYPMLYHEMIRKTTDYISEYLGWLNRKAPGAKLTPILQVKSMPDGLPDTLEFHEMQNSYLAARSHASKVAWFSWDGLEETGKIKIFQQIINTESAR